jgi:hypothetical protein
MKRKSSSSKGMVMKTKALSAAVLAIGVSLTGSPPCAAQDAETERLSRECNKIYAGLCKDIKRGPEMLGKCFERHPGIADKIPAKCEADFQLNIEGYNDAKRQQHN